MSASRPWPGPAPEAPLVLGVEPDQDRHLVVRAARVAARMGTGVVCTWVDPTHVPAAESVVGIDGTIPTAPLDPDRVDDDTDAEEPSAILVARLAEVLDPLHVPWCFAYRVGEATRGLTAEARERDAAMIVVGARRPGFGGWMNEMIGGSVAGRLAHTQAVPVLVLPAKHEGELTAR
ncbi:universal stress protein [Occultella kanbiaonis]|uniref:universal stress protein n=1 Tax=Occultella kanbiaonis TaxID=2675754 RepID=UPI0012B79B59|nr:universal stress protein [Occultella kanbiaonis]